MKIFLQSKLAAFVAGAALMLYAQIAAAPLAQAPSGWGRASKYVPGEVLVKFKGAASPQAHAASVTAKGHAVLASLGAIGWTHVRLGAGQSVDDALAAYRSDPSVDAAQPNYIYRKSAAPNDPQYGQLWAFKNTGQTITNALTQPPGSSVSATNNPGTANDDMNIETAWGLVNDCSSVIVAVVDSGVNYNHQDLAPNMWDGSAAGFPNHGTDFIDNDNDPMDLLGHGTHVAGIIGAKGNNGSGGTGVCWKASIMAVRVLDAHGDGTTVTLTQGVNFAVAHGAKVINMSIGGANVPDPALGNAITNAQNNDVVVIVAAGNESANNEITPTYPCNFTNANLVCVAALDQSYALASFSNFGASKVHVGAPGTNIVSTWAGTVTRITDNFGRPGALNWTTSGGGWANGLAAGSFDAMLNPSNFPSGAYANSVDQRAYKAFDLTGKNSATLSFFAGVEIALDGDALNLNYRAGGGDPFAGGTQLQGGAGSTGGFVPFEFNLPCAGGMCAVGFQLLSNASGTDLGTGILLFSIDALALNATSYDTISGTSMATPMVAGLAAMLRAYNPQFTYVDTVNAIKNSGRAVPALAGKTTTGKAVDAMSALAFVNPPAGLAAALQ